ncbi:hypothetical protein OIV83_001153 [Microbotryomycetes sp. JL201]|nr:hypothetical protein OIV83_001153 [Microbotryomycetes sp. JL201]
MASVNKLDIPYFTLADGKQIPWLAWGNGTGNARQTAIESGDAALKAGLRHIDTAQGYNNETETGECIAKSGVPREDIWVTTKLSQKDGSPNNPPIPLSALRASVNASIHKLGFQPSLILVHNPFVPEAGKLVEFWQVLEDMKDKGELTASLGVSNFRPQDLEELLKVARHPITVNQLEYHPYVLEHLDPVLKIMEKHNIRVEAYGPLSPILRHPNGGPLKPLLAKIAHRLSSITGRDVDQAAVLLLWCKAKGVIAVTASANPDNIKKLAALQGLPDLEQSEVDEIEAVGRKIHFRAYDEHMCIDFPAPNLPSQ